jgi:hypothetical protein
LFLFVMCHLDFSDNLVEAIKIPIKYTRKYFTFLKFLHGFLARNDKFDSRVMRSALIFI